MFTYFVNIFFVFSEKNSEKMIRNKLLASSRTLVRCFCTSFRPKPPPLELNIGQPTPFTHPHLFRSRLECTPGITHQEYKTRRHNLMTALSETHLSQAFDRHIVILSASELRLMSNDIPYPFHQDVDFLYLTGLNEPDAIAVLELSEANSITYLLFVRPKNPKRELWDGAVVGEQAAVDYFNADQAYPLKSFSSVLRERYGDKKSCIWVKRGKEVNKTNATEFEKTFQSKPFQNSSLEDARLCLQKLRVVKSTAEMEIMRNSAMITSKAFKAVMKLTPDGVSENQLHAMLEYQCRALGAQHLSFPPVVASGSRANTLHYISNNQLLSNGDVVLMDGGCVYHGYASDVTRTWPVSGKFTQPQAELYNVVLRVLKACMEKCNKSSSISLDSLHNAMLTLLGQELQQLNLIDPTLSRDSELQRAAANFCPHHLGHYLGMDTHDCLLVSRSAPLVPGVAFTLEPGLYIPNNAVDVPKEYRGIGIRIEDDVVMTENGALVMNSDLPKEIGDIESLMSGFDCMKA